MYGGNNGGDEQDDPFLSGTSRRGSIASVLAEARASLANPSRPFTPAQSERHLFESSEYASRPSSAFPVNSSLFSADRPMTSSSSSRLGLQSSLGRPPTSSASMSRAYALSSCTPLPSGRQLSNPSVSSSSSASYDRPASRSGATPSASASLSASRSLAAESISKPQIRSNGAQVLSINQYDDNSSEDDEEEVDESQYVDPAPYQPKIAASKHKPQVDQNDDNNDDNDDEYEDEEAIQFKKQLRLQQKQQQQSSRKSQEIPQHRPSSSSISASSSLSQVPRPPSSPGSKPSPRSPSKPSAESASPLLQSTPAPLPVDIQRDMEWEAIQSLLTLLEPTTPSTALHQAVDKLSALVERTELAAPNMAFSRPGTASRPATALAGSSSAASPVNFSASFTADEREKRRRTILQKVSKLMDSTDTRILIKLGIIILRLFPGGPFLLSTCKLLFKLSKDEKNDALFRQEKALEPLVKVLGSRQDVSLEIMIYVIGALKNVTANDAENIQSLSRQGVVATIASLLTESIKAVDIGRGAAAPSILPATSIFNTEKSEKLVQFLVQVTALLRNLAVDSSVVKQFPVFGVIESMVPMLESCGKHSELMVNVSRALSKLSTHEDTRATLYSCSEPLIKGLLFVLSLHSNNLSLVVRVAFVLGNLTHKHAENRLLVAKYKGIPLLMRLLRTLCELEIAAFSNPAASSSSSSSSSSGAAASGERPFSASGRKPSSSDSSSASSSLPQIQEALVKIIRVVANVAIHPDLGPGLAAAPEIELLFDLLNRYSTAAASSASSASASSSKKSSSSSAAVSTEELVLNVVGCITNVSFYSSESNRVLQASSYLSQFLVPLLLGDNPEAVIEAARAFANFSQEDDVREFIRNQRVDEALLLLLDHNLREVVFNICGTIVNMTGFPAPPSAQPTFSNADAVMKLVDVLERSMDGDLNLSTVVLKILVNICDDEHHVPPTDAIISLESAVAHFMEYLQDREDALDNVRVHECMGVAVTLQESIAALREEGLLEEDEEGDLEPL